MDSVLFFEKKILIKYFFIHGKYVYLEIKKKRISYNNFKKLKLKLTI